MNVAVRVDASTEIGLGHVRRCLSLGQALQADGADVHFVTRNLGVDVVGPVTTAGFRCSLLRAPRAEERDGLAHEPMHAGWAQVSAHVDAEETALALAQFGADWLVVDHYAFDARWHEAISGRGAIRVAVVDDLADRPLAADLLIDHNFAPDHRAKYAGRLDPAVPILGGPRFALLDASYETAARYAFQEVVRSIGIFMGGADVADVSRTVLLACREHVRFDGAIEIATTRQNPHHRALIALAETWPHTTVTLDQPDLAAFFGRHDLQVGAGGGATWERCCIGAPTQVLVVADNQRHVIEPLVELGILHAVLHAPHSPASVGVELDRMIKDVGLRRRGAEKGRALVDGQGTRRVAHAMRTG